MESILKFENSSENLNPDLKMKSTPNGLACDCGADSVTIIAVNQDFSDSALLLLGHGSTMNADSAAPVYQHARELRGRGFFARIEECFWQQNPSVQEVIDKITQPRAFIVPFFTGEGYFAGRVIPEALGFRQTGEAPFSRVMKAGAQTRFYCRAVGTHESMTDVLLARAKGVMEQFPFPRCPAPAETTLFIAGHGTGRSETSRETVERQVDRIRRREIYAEVHPVFIEEPPFIEECYTLARTKFLVMVPFFMSDGLHSNEDIPEMLGESRRIVEKRLEAGQPTWRNPTEKRGKLVWYSGCVGTEPLIAEVILERIREAASGAA